MWMYWAADDEKIFEFLGNVSFAKSECKKEFTWLKNILILQKFSNQISRKWQSECNIFSISLFGIYYVA